MTRHHTAAREIPPDEMAAGVADAMFALSTPSRVRILMELRERPHTVKELMTAITMEQSAVSHQLRLLREHNLVASERRGRERLYTLQDANVAALLDAAVSHVGAPGGRAGQGRRASRASSSRPAA